MQRFFRVTPPAVHGMGECAIVSWKLKRLQTSWFDGVGQQQQAARERSRDEKFATFGEETQEVSSIG